MEERTKDVIDSGFLFKPLSVPEWISIVTIGLILLGFFNVYTYYSSFGIDITSYLEPSEIIFSFSSIFVIIIFACIFLFVNIVIGAMKDRLLHPDTAKKIPRGAMIIIYGAASAVLSHFIFSSPVVAVQPDVFHVILVFALLMIPIIVKSTSLKIYISFGVLMTCLLLSNVLEYRELTKNNNPKYFVEFQSDGKIVSSTSQLLYIGSTRNSVFMWDNCSRKAIRYPTDKIDWISIEVNSKRK